MRDVLCEKLGRICAFEICHAVTRAWQRDDNLIVHHVRAKSASRLYHCLSLLPLVTSATDFTQSFRIAWERAGFLAFAPMSSQQADWEERHERFWADRSLVASWFAEAISRPSPWLLASFDTQSSQLDLGGLPAYSKLLTPPLRRSQPVATAEVVS